MPQLDKAAEQFDSWMKNFEDSHRESGHLDDNNKALVNFLNGDQGFRYVKTYEELCELAVLLQKKGYKTTNPPCEPSDFAKAIVHANPESFGYSKPVIPESARELLAADQERYKQKIDDYISRRVKEIEAIEDPQTKIGESCALGLIASGLFKDTRYQAACKKEAASAAERQECKSPSLTHTGYE